MAWFNIFSNTPDIAVEDAAPDLMGEAYEAEANELEGEPVEASVGDFYDYADPNVYVVAPADHSLLSDLLGL